MTTEEKATNGGAAIAREEFGARSLEKRRETAQSAMVAQARASIEAMYVMALQRPRSWLDVRSKLLIECERPGFAQAAIFVVPRGRKTIEGLSIRFAEGAARLAGNLRRGSRVTYEDDEKRILNVYVIDLETNSVGERDIVVTKVIERRDPSDRLVFTQRKNTAGETVYLVACTDDELFMKEGALVSKVSRTLTLAAIPADIREECERKCRATRAAEVKRDPDAERKRLADSFAELRVMPADLAAYLGHDLAQTTPAELETLRGVYVALRDGDASWTEIAGEKAKPAEAQAEAKVTRQQKLAEKVRAKIAAKKAAEELNDSALAQVEAIKQAIVDAKTDEEKAKVRERIVVFEGPEAICAELGRMYSVLHPEVT
jgi:hypothetical protein